MERIQSAIQKARIAREGKLPAAFKLPGHSGAYVYAVADVEAYIATLDGAA